jgi:hypothetical protein
MQFKTNGTSQIELFPHPREVLFQNMELEGAELSSL